MADRTVTDFTEASYAMLLDAAASRFQFRRIDDDLSGSGIALWRHDVDFSPHRALALARMEAKRSLTANYFVLFTSPFYSALEPKIIDIFREIAGLGHSIGLHYDASMTRSLEADEARLTFEANTLATLLDRPITTFSLHTPTVVTGPSLDAVMHAGLLNASSSTLRNRFEYCSDSNGLWRFRSLHDVVADSNVERLYALTHPEWWQSEPMPPRQRLQRCIDGRKASSETYYDALLSAHNRPNIGRKGM